MGYNEVTFLSDRVCGICGFATAPPIPRRWKTRWVFRCQNGADDPRHSAGGRTPALASAQLGLACHFTGFDSGFMQFFRVVKPP